MEAREKPYREGLRTPQEGAAFMVSIHICLSVCMSVRLSILLSICPSVRPSVCLSIVHGT